MKDHLGWVQKGLKSMEPKNLRLPEATWPITIDLLGDQDSTLPKRELYNYSTWRRDFVEMTHDFMKHLQ